MRIAFTIPLQAMSVNSYTYADKRHKTKEAREWEEQMALYLDEIKELSEFEHAWKSEPAKRPIAIYITVYYPYHIFFNKQGEISAKTKDCSNVEKPILDRIFGARIDVNDRFVKWMTSSKKPGVTHSIHIELEFDSNGELD